jgi:hypothetical protein
MRVHFGSDYPLYFVKHERVLVILLNAGDKSTQKRDIRRALETGIRTWRRSVTKPKKPLKLIAFDAARYLDDDDAIADYMTVMLETNDPALLLLALSDVARAKGMAQVAKVVGLSVAPIAPKQTRISR